jgi:hypothetical protein
MRLGVMATITQKAWTPTPPELVCRNRARVKRARGRRGIGSLGRPDTDPGKWLLRAPEDRDGPRRSWQDQPASTPSAPPTLGAKPADHQHIGAYQVELAGGEHITFIDIPTDIGEVLVVRLMTA